MSSGSLLLLLLRSTPGDTGEYRIDHKDWDYWSKQTQSKACILIIITQLHQSASCPKWAGDWMARGHDGRRLSQKSATVGAYCIVAVFGDSRRFLRQCGQGLKLSNRFWLQVYERLVRTIWFNG